MTDRADEGADRADEGADRADEGADRADDGGASAEETDARDRRESPFSDLARRVRERRTGEEAGAAEDEGGHAAGDGVGATAADGETGGVDDGWAGTTDDPFADLDASGEAGEGDDPFESVDVGDLPGDDVWSALEGESEPAAQPSVGTDDAEAVERDDPAADRPDHVVPKASYCQRCEHFTAPPEVACTHEGTEILAVVDAESFRVRGCPVARDDSSDGG
ncbi:MAG: hypothetical protein ABEJ61_00585 [Haloferacaceae archaeon]